MQLAAGLAAESSQHIDAEAAEPIPRKSCGVTDSNLSQASEISFRLNVFDPMSASFCSSVSFFLVFFRAKRARARRAFQQDQVEQAETIQTRNPPTISSLKNADLRDADLFDLSDQITCCVGSPASRKLWSSDQLPLGSFLCTADCPQERLCPKRVVTCICGSGA